MLKEPKVNIHYGTELKVKMNYIVDPEHFKKVTCPALLQAIEAVETIKETKAV